MKLVVVLVDMLVDVSVVDLVGLSESYLVDRKVVEKVDQTVD